MPPNLLGSLADALIPIGGGILATLYAFRLIGKPPGTDVKLDEWHRRFGRLLRILGPLMILTGMGLSVGTYLSSRESQAPLEELSLFPTGIGTTWVYQSRRGDFTVRVTAHEQAQGVLCARREASVDGRVTFTTHVRPDRGTMLQHTVNGHRYSPALPLVTNKAGQTRWEYRSADAKLVFQCDQSEGGPLQTPLAAYDRTVRVSMRGSEAQGDIVLQSWYVDRVGLVREFTKTPAGESLLELKSFSPPQNSRP